jgi:hypothetical protein
MTAFSYIKFVPPDCAWLGFQAVTNILIPCFCGFVLHIFTSELFDY